MTCRPRQTMPHGQKGEPSEPPSPEWGPSFHCSCCQIFSPSKGQLELVKGYLWTLKRDGPSHPQEESHREKTPGHHLPSWRCVGRQAGIP